MFLFKPFSQRESRVDLHASFLLPLPRIMWPCAKTNIPTWNGRRSWALVPQFGHMLPVFRGCVNSELEKSIDELWCQWWLVSEAPERLHLKGTATNLAGTWDDGEQARAVHRWPQACGSRHPARLHTASGALSFLLSCWEPQELLGPPWGCKSDNRA